jgi:hypothetical protein
MWKMLSSFYTAAPQFNNAFQPVFRIRTRSESTCFWASWIRIRILLSSCKNSKKNLDSYYFVTLFDFLSLENYVNVPSKSNKQKKCVKLKIIFVGILKVNDEKSRIRTQNPDPDPGEAFSPQKRTFSALQNEILYFFYICG